MTTSNTSANIHRNSDESYFAEGTLKEIIGIGTHALKIKVAPTADFSLRIHKSDYIAWIRQIPPTSEPKNAELAKTDVAIAVEDSLQCESILQTLLAAKTSGKPIRIRATFAGESLITLTSIDLI